MNISSFTFNFSKFFYQIIISLKFSVINFNPHSGMIVTETGVSLHVTISNFNGWSLIKLANVETC
jgi:hypothetical protein